MFYFTVNSAGFVLYCTVLIQKTLTLKNCIILDAIDIRRSQRWCFIFIYS